MCKPTRNSYLFKIVAIAILLHFSVSISAQSLNAYKKAGDKALAQKNYYAAYEFFKAALAIDSSDVGVLYNFAQSAYYWRSYREANYYFSKVQNDDAAANFKELDYLHGYTKKHLSEYDQAIRLFQQYWKSSSNQNNKATALREVKACKKAKNIINQPIEVQITHLSKSINSPYSEFAPLKVGKELYYSSMQFKTANKDGTVEYYTKILTSTPNSRGRIMGRKINLPQTHNANVTFDEDENIIYFTRCNNQTDGSIKCSIYRRKLNDRRPKDEKLSINQEEYTFTHPNIAIDKTTNAKTLYFVSDMPDGQGGLDIWYSLIENDNFSTPLPLDATINTAGDEITPFYHVASQTLYFSSDFHDGLGGFDIFKSQRFADNTWSIPQNIGYPLNSSYNDTYFSISENEEKGYLSSNREGSFTITKGACCNDIYAFNFSKTPEPIESIDTIPLIVEQPIDTIPAIEQPPIITNTPKTWIQLESLLPIPLYFDNDHPNPKTIQTSTDLTYQQTFFDFYNKKQNFITTYTAPLSDINKEDATRKIDAFFEDEIKGNYDRLNGVMDFLLEELKKGQPIIISLKGYTSPRASGKYNQYLAARRISSVRNYFEQWQNGKLRPFLNTNQLTIIEVPLGETKASTSVSDDLNDSRNSIYSVEASRERRVEILDVNNGDR